MASFLRSFFPSRTNYDTLPQDADVPLLENGNANNEEEPLPRAPPARKPIYLWSIAILCASVLGFAVATFIWYQPASYSATPGTTQPASPIPPTTPTQPTPPTPPGDDATERARKAVDELFERQSKTLEQATTRYTLKNNRPPPPGYDKFFSYAQQKRCLIDDYDRVHRDFEPFYQIAETNPSYFKDMVEKSMKLGQEVEPTRLTTYKLDKKPERTHNFYSPFAGDWEAALRMVADVVSPIDVVFNYQDEPRVLVNTRLPDAKEHATEVSDENPFNQRPKPTKDFFAEPGTRHQCIIPNSEYGFGNSTNDVNGFMLYSSSTRFTTDLYPMLSQTKISPCFADILIPSSYYYQRSGWSTNYQFPDTKPWSEKKPVLYWRGSTTGGSYMGDNWRSFTRFRFLDLVKEHPDIMDGAFTAMKNCDAECPEDKIKEIYGIGSPLPKENEYNFKYLLDIDGNTFSGRYLGMLRSGSLIFKSTIFSEFFEDWLKPYEHYIPVLPDLSDLEDKVRWAIANDEEARRIQLMGSIMANRLMTDEQNDCYYYAVLLEYARLQKMQ